MSRLTKLNASNLDVLSAVLDEYPEAWIHGDGNIYADEKNSNHHQDFTNENNPNAVMRCKYKSGDTLPETVEQAEKDMINFRAKEQAQKSLPTGTGERTRTIKVKSKAPSPSIDLKELGNK